MGQFAAIHKVIECHSSHKSGSIRVVHKPNNIMIVTASDKSLLLHHMATS